MSDKQKEQMILVPLELIKAVSYVGVDFGFGKYELEQKHIQKARELFEKSQPPSGE